MPKKGDLTMKAFVIGMIGLTGYGAFALSTSLYQLKQFNQKYANDQKEKK